MVVREGLGFGTLEVVSRARRSQKQLVVVEDSGERRPFLRGLVTHQLLQRGLTFDDAYSIAQALRGQLSGRDEVTAAELRDLVDTLLHQQFGDTLLPDPAASSSPDIEIVYEGEPFPFSRGVLARSLLAAGLEAEQAYASALAVLDGLRLEALARIESTDLAERVAEHLEEYQGQPAARRYRLMRSVRRLPKPLVIYLGGASGTGKSTLSFELAPLLRIYRMNSTDSIRQVMRMVFAPAILPSIHRSSFETDFDLVEASEDDVHLGFEEQATRVCVGVRAIVERSIAENTNVMVEGVHLFPPLVPFPELDGEAYQLMLLLETQDENTHRSHFLTRTQRGRRRAERYLSHFESIRSLQTLLLERAEAADIPTLDTTDREATVPRALRLLTDQLTSMAPSLAESAAEPESVPAALMLILDGVGDLPVEALGGRTPLEAANTPNLDRLARQGSTGLADPVGVGIVPDTASGNLAIFGQSPQAMSRGPIEAIGCGLKLQEGDIALRGNFATVDDHGIVTDRRAGRIRKDAEVLAKELDNLTLPLPEFSDVTFKVRAGTEHRMAVALIGADLSADIQGSDPGNAAIPGPSLEPRATTDDASAVRTAQALALFESEARKVLTAHPLNARRTAAGLLPANCILTRGAGRTYDLVAPSPAGVPIRTAAVSGDRTVLGIARAAGATISTSSRMTANLDTDLSEKFRHAAELLDEHDVVFLHIKGADIAAHDRRPELKVQFIEKVDEALGDFLSSYRGAPRIAIASDHCTRVDSGQHSADPVPVLVWGHDIVRDEVDTFHERAVSQGSLQRFPLQTLISRLLERAET